MPPMLIRFAVKQEERHRQQDEGIVGVEGFLREHHHRQPRLDQQDRQACEPEREGDRNTQDEQQPMKTPNRTIAAWPAERTLPLIASLRTGSALHRRICSPANTIHVKPATGHAT